MRTPPLPANPSPTEPTADDAVIGQFRPRITLMTLGRGEGLLGLKPQGKLGPRGDSVTLAQFDWTYRTPAGDRWETPAPSSILNSRPAEFEELFDTGGPLLRLQRNLLAEADAMDTVWDMGFVPLADTTFQWRNQKQRPHLGSVWTLPQEEHFGDFWADQVPQLQAQGWTVVVQPGFAHESVPVQRWKLVVSPDTGEVLGKELDSPLVKPGRGVEKLQLPAREGAWLLSLGIEIDGQTLDLAPMLADLLRRDPQVLQLADADAQHFTLQLKRSLLDVEQHKLAAGLFAFEMTRPNDELARLFERSQRGLDLQLSLRNDRDHSLLLVLLPLTSPQGSEGYLARINLLLHEHFGIESSLESLGVRVLPFNLEPGCERNGLRNFLFNECGLNDQQVAV